MGLKATGPGRAQNREPGQVWGRSWAFLSLRLRAGPPWDSGCDPDLLKDPPRPSPALLVSLPGRESCLYLCTLPPNTPTCLVPTAGFLWQLHPPPPASEAPRAES